MERVKWGQLTPLQEDNQDYEPEMEEIMEYGQFIGLALPEDNKYLYLAKEGLKAPLPPFWQACEDPQGDLYFRNRKTRAITLENPLDEIYIQKVRQIRQLDAENNIFSIAEESALNESSGLVKSKPRIDQRYNGLNPPPQNTRILERHITEESIYSEPSAERGSPLRSQLQEEPQWKVQQRKQLAELRANVQRFVPEKHQLITHATEVEARGLANIMRPQDLVELAGLRLLVEEKRAKLEQRKQERRNLQATLDQVRTQTRPN